MQNPNNKSAFQASPQTSLTLLLGLGSGVTPKPFVKRLALSAVHGVCAFNADPEHPKDQTPKLSFVGADDGHRPLPVT